MVTMSMKCIDCGGPTQVNRTIQKGNYVIRYRQCTLCDIRFKTIETHDLNFMQTRYLVKQLQNTVEMFNKIY